MEEVPTRFESILNKVVMFLNQDNITPTKPNNDSTQLIMFKNEAKRLKQYIEQHGLGVRIEDEKEVNSRRVKITLKKVKM